MAGQSPEEWQRADEERADQGARSSRAAWVVVIGVLVLFAVAAGLAGGCWGDRPAAHGLPSPGGPVKPGGQE